MKFNLRLLSGYAAIILTFLYGSVALLVAIYFQKAAEFLFDPLVAIPYFSMVAGLYMTFQIETAEHTAEVEQELLQREAQGLEFFNTADAFLAKLTEMSVGAEIIATLNFSPPAGRSAALDQYFSDLHGYISRQGTPLRSFRSIASIEDASKAQFAVERAWMFRKNPRVSFSSFAEAPGIRLLCYHVVVKQGVGYCAIYPPVPLTGVMNAAIIVNRQLAQMLLEQFEVSWSQSVPVLAGGNPSMPGLTFLQGLGARADSRAFKDLARLATPKR